MMLFDQHTHSLNSHEKASISTVEEMCEGALKCGLSGLTISDHYDLGRRQPEEVCGFIRQSIQDVNEAKEKYRGRLQLGLGIELGEGHQDPDESKNALELGQYDIVLGSLHNVYGRRDFSAIGRDFSDKRALFKEYMDEQIQMAQWGKYDVLTHLTYPFRYYLLGTDVPNIEEFEGELRALFKILAEKGKGLEVNTSGFYRPEHGLPMPNLWELKLFRECGGEFVTTGSDAHDMNHVGGGIKQGIELLKAAGFHYQAVYKQRMPEMTPL